MEGLCWMKDRLGGCDIVKATVPLSFLWRSTDLAGYLCREPETALSVSSVSEVLLKFIYPGMCHSVNRVNFICIMIFFVKELGFISVWYE